MTRAFAVLVPLLLAAGCLAGDEPPTGTTPVSGTPPSVTPARPTPQGPAPDISGVDALVAANTRFAMDAFRALSDEKVGENLVFSPYSISTALQMLYGGANGTTRAAIAEALRLGDAEPTLDADAAALLANLTSSDPNVTLRIGNSLWIDEEFAPEVNPAFTERTRASYDAEVFRDDFKDEATVDRIDAWASERTEGKIPDVMDSISPDEVLFLINAVYFAGEWGMDFNKTCTHRAPFRTDAGESVEVDMMCGAPEKAHTFSRSAERTIARLPYGGDDRFAMYVVLPPNGTELDAFAASWDGNLSGTYSPFVELEMPRLDIETRALDLQPLLTKLGMGVAFGDRADLTRIAPNLAVSRATHDAMLEVDEEGTVAAAVTVIGTYITSLPPPPEPLVIDRPFLVTIRDDASGSILFMAKVHDPSA